MDTLDWAKAEHHLRMVEAAYAETGSAGMLAAQLIIVPCRDRFNTGERSQDLYDEIFEIEL